MEYEEGFYRPALRDLLLAALDGHLQEPAGRDGWLIAFTEDPVKMEREYQSWVNEYVRPGNSWR